MPTVKASLRLTDNNNSVDYSFIENASYQQLFQVDKVVDSTDSPETQKLVSFTPGSKGAGTVLDDFEFLCVYI